MRNKYISLFQIFQIRIIRERLFFQNIFNNLYISLSERIRSPNLG